METLGEDLLLLAVRPDGKLGASAKLRFGLSALIYPGFAGAAARKNLKKAAKRERSASPAVGAATSAAVDASIRAATDAAVAASIDAATQAAISAATDASAHHSGAAGGHP